MQFFVAFLIFSKKIEFYAKNPFFKKLKGGKMNFFGFVNHPQ